MAEYISFQPSDYFNTKLFTGTGSTLAVTGVGFQPDFVWQKNRSITASHLLTDAVREYDSQLYSNSSSAEGVLTNVLTSFDADGFTAGTSSDFNGSGNDIVTWNWKAATTAVPSGGTITPSACSFNTTSGFGIYTYTGNSTSGATIAHGLGAVPKVVLVKRTDGANSWCMYHVTKGNNYLMNLDDTGAGSTSTGHWNDTTPTSTVFSLGNSGEVNDSSETYVAYVFCDKAGYAKFSGYTGNGNADGAFVYTGFRPAFILTKNTAITGDWFIADDRRPGANAPYNYTLLANTTGAEVTSGGNNLDILSNGFKAKTSSGYTNGSGNSIVYLAFAEFPTVSSNDVPGVAR